MTSSTPTAPLSPQPTSRGLGSRLLVPWVTANCAASVTFLTWNCRALITTTLELERPSSASS
eukprot:3934585-Heterocapsa_arctica.AAC.1